MNDKTAARLRINRKLGEILNTFSLMVENHRKLNIWPSGDFCSGCITAQIMSVDPIKKEYTLEVLSELNFSDFEKEQSFYIQEKVDNVLFKVIMDNFDGKVATLKIPYEIRVVENRKFTRFRLNEKKTLVLNIDNNVISVNLSNFSQGGLGGIVHEEFVDALKESKKITLSKVGDFELEEKFELELRHLKSIEDIENDLNNTFIGLKFLNELDQRVLKVLFQN